MAKQYWIGDYYVDVSRNQIRKESEPQTLPPKALQVLTHLAENPGKVVSYDELLDAVWPNSVVTPNTLQRSIAQLRKAFGEDSKALSENGKSQDIIKTHSKQGYSLESEVKWQALEPAQTSPVNLQAAKQTVQHTDPQIKQERLHQTEQQVHAKNIKRYGGFLVVLVIAVVLVLFNSKTHTPDLVQGEMHYITATDDKEFDASWSPNGDFILFHRYPEKLCINHIWAKNADSMQEQQLTRDLGTYSYHSLSPDEQNLVYIKQQDCNKPVTQNVCYQLMSLDFQQALQQPQPGRELLSCENSAIKSPVWIDDQHIVLLQKNAQVWRMVRYSISDASTTEFYQVQNGSIENIKWSAQQQRFVVTSIKEGGSYYIDMVSSEGELISSHKVKLAENSPQFMRLRPAFIPGSDKLIFTDRRDIYTLTTDGEVQLQDFTFEGNVGSPVFHPNGKRLLLVKGRYDSDIARVSLNASEQTDHGKEVDTAIDDTAMMPFSIFKRSNAHDDNAKFQPGSNQIAFISGRTGSEQLWLGGEDTQPRLLSDLPEGSYVANIQWSQGGKAVLILASRELYQVDVAKTSDQIAGEQNTEDKSRQTKYLASYPIEDLFHWNHENQTVTANIQLNGSIRFVEIDLATMDYQLINDKLVNWAAKSTGGPLIFMDHLNRYWQKTELEDKLIPELNGKTRLKGRFVIHQHTIYSINKQDQLWSYKLDAKEFQILGNPPPLTDYLTDASENELLFTHVIAAKKEIVELGVKGE